MAADVDAGPDGQAPLDADEAAGLLVPVATQGALNRVEAVNVLSAIQWAGRRRLTTDEVVTVDFARELHRRMFGEVWSWAGEYRRSDKNLGVPWFEIPIHVRRVVDDAREWLSVGMDHDEIAVHFGHRLVSVHAFANGNGRHSRLASDCLARALGRRAFGWRGGGIEPPGVTRAAYLDAVRAADAGDVGPLLAFARSRGR